MIMYAYVGCIHLEHTVGQFSRSAREGVVKHLIACIKNAKGSTILYNDVATLCISSYKCFLHYTLPDSINRTS